ncbi:uncharacterized protein LOC118740296 [Rhagoletis pomonella]|uniref:uncharacterized protein LOC118740296 n=1 Tax=Rhagoletis pomonella TaxID=28610 RepID=UPI0017862F1C|nr:uncharacterized protein LOC118740296 [Rhagoletis pomonella]
MATTKSGQSAKRLSEPSQLDNSLIFLEPTLNSAASTTSNLMDVANNSPTSPTDIMYEVEFLETDDLESTPSTSKTTPTPSAKRRRMEKEDADFAKTVESALQTITSASKTDKWDDLRGFVSSSGRELNIENPLSKLSKDSCKQHRCLLRRFNLILAYQDIFILKYLFCN